MNSRKPFIAKLMRVSALMVIFAWFATGCSESSESVAGGSQSPIESSAPESGTDSSNTPNGVEDIVITNDTNEESSASANVERLETTEQTTTQVDFRITVPAYKSNELLVRLNWGSVETTASWVRDESWFVSENFPVNSESLLVVTFADKNGKIELGTYEQLLTTTLGPVDSFLIQAEQFDTDRWDTDGDGVSNLSELLAGTDPLIDESQSLEIRDDLSLNTLEAVPNLQIYSGIHEALIPDERPYFEDTRVETPVEFSGENFFDINSLTIDIDVNGNGTLAKYNFDKTERLYHITIEQEGTRTHTGSSVQWSSTLSRWSLEASCLHLREFTSESRRVNDRTLTQEGFQMHRNLCSTDTRVLYDTTYNLTGVVTGDSSLCEATAGNVTVESFSFGIPTKVSTWEFSKEPDDIYWTANNLDNNGQLIEEFLMAIDFKFYCEFHDL